MFAYFNNLAWPPYPPGNRTWGATERSGHITNSPLLPQPPGNPQQACQRGVTAVLLAKTHPAILTEGVFYGQYNTVCFTTETMIELKTRSWKECLSGQMVPEPTSCQAQYIQQPTLSSLVIPESSSGNSDPVYRGGN